ncbi:Peptide methionine sulfoxide reductase MsrA [BD1-7 clade bacterium]|uniref:Peptide methionine sulfoxide reductase MsrA n=1 Tax=BD1-7 clade bacterium TaxID=2029982 RepID=A0A5S9QA42_9GAMM|nr:Peptide methionine sulfoxide reductase MsrA [BD1-7 clade bacterium]
MLRLENPSLALRGQTLRIAFIVVVLISGISSHWARADTAIFAGGCFWCMEADFEKLPGVEKVVSGYTGGHVKNPTYSQVVSESTGHYEAIKVSFDPEQVSYQTLLSLFWHTVDPFDNRGQFCDKGPSYRSAIFYLNAAQEKAAKQSLTKLNQRFHDQAIATDIQPAQVFYPAESYHQEYYLKNPVRYKFYRWNCGRDQRLEQIWGTQANKP